MTEQAALRASDADRERVAERLRHAAAEGRLLADELEERLGIALSAKTYGQLDAVVSDLPKAALDQRRRPPQQIQLRRPVLALVAVLFMLMIVAEEAFTYPGHTGHDGVFGFHSGAPVVWLLWLAIGWRVLARRRGQR